jgi:hypothetical protein
VTRWDVMIISASGLDELNAMLVRHGDFCWEPVTVGPRQTGHGTEWYAVVKRPIAQSKNVIEVESLTFNKWPPE